MAGNALYDSMTRHQRVPERPTPGITGYHGSPYDFEKFDTSKIGTGDGVKKYGLAGVAAGGAGAYDGLENKTKPHWSSTLRPGDI